MQPCKWERQSCKAVANIGPTFPPQRKGRLPKYNGFTFEDLQNKFDELEATGEFSKPEQVNIHVEYLNTSSLAKKLSGGSTLVTFFGEVVQYSKHLLCLTPNVDGTLRDMGKWKYMPWSSLIFCSRFITSSMKYSGVAKPFKSIRLHTFSYWNSWLGILP